MDKKVGPRISDAKFFGEMIDCCLPGLEGIPEAVDNEDYALCRKLFCAHVRESLRQREDIYFGIPYEFPENNFMLHDESIDDAVARIKKNKLAAVGIPYQFGEKVDWFSNHAPDNYKEWTFQLNRHPEFKLLANYYRETGDESVADAFAKLFDSWVKQAVVPVEAEETSSICWRTIECGIRMGANWPYTLFAFYKSSAFTDDLLVDWYKSVWEHGHYLHQKHRQKGNWLIMEMNGLGQIGILYPQFKASANWLNYALELLGEELKRQVYPDGFQYELTTAYQYVVIKNYIRFIKVSDAFDIEIPKEFLNDMEKMLDIYIRIMMPNGFSPDLNDGGNKLVKVLLEGLLPYFPHNKQFEWACQGRIGDGEPKYQSVALEYAGIMVMRDGWQEDSTWALMDAAPFGTSHQHEDKLNLLIHAKGRTILTEGGNYAYDGSEMRNYVCSTRSHNTIRVDGMDQNRRADYVWHPEDIQLKADMDYIISPEFDYVSSMYSEGYGEGKDKSVSHQRTVLFVKQPGKGMVPFFIVIDRLHAEEERCYEILWHVDAEEVSLQGMKARADFLHIITSMHNEKTDGVDVISGQQYPEWQGWKREKKFELVQGDHLPQPVIRYHTMCSTKRIVTVLYPEENCPIVDVEAGKNITDNTITLVMSNGEHVEYKEF